LIAARPPLATTGQATDVATSSAKLHATVDAEGSPTDYYFEYGPTASYGSKAPIPAKRLGSGLGGVAVSEVLSDLLQGATYHYRVVATSPEGATNGEDQTFVTQSSGTAKKLTTMPVTEPFDGSTESLANFNTKWSTLGWASGASPKGEDTTSGWRPVNAYPTLNGAYYNPTLTDSGSGVAAVATMATNPGITERHFSLWLDMPTPGSTRAGYELRFKNTATNTYEVKLCKWISGTETVLASKSGVSFVNGNTFAIVDQGSAVSAWTDTGSGFGELLSTTDSAFSSGNAGLSGAGNIARLTKFKAGAL
jgi:hypothetical protein